MKSVPPHMAKAMLQKGLTPLHQAALLGEAEQARALIEQGASLDARDANGRTPLHIAAGLNRAAIVRLLLDAGADDSPGERHGDTAADSARMFFASGAQAVFAARQAAPPMELTKRIGVKHPLQLRRRAP